MTEVRGFESKPIADTQSGAVMLAKLIERFGYVVLGRDDNGQKKPKVRSARKN